MASMVSVASMASCLSELESVSDWPCTADISCWCCWCCCWREDISHYYSGIYHISNIIQSQVQLGLCTPRSQDESNRSNRSAQMCPVWDRTRIHSKTSTKHEVGLGWQIIWNRRVYFSHAGWTTFILSMLRLAACGSLADLLNQAPLRVCKKLSVYNHLKVLSTEKDV